MHTGETWALGHRPGLDALRGAAVALVVAYHAGWTLPGGWIGVDLFFALSGFLITSLLIERGVNLRAFWAARFRRLAPALIVCVAVVYAATRDATAVYGITYTANIAATNGVDLGPLGHLWSLALEEQFYLLWPLALAAILAHNPRPLHAAATLTATAATAYAWSWHLFTTNGTDAYYHPATRAGTLLLGCALAAAMRDQRFRDTTQRAAIPTGATALLVIAAAATVLPPASMTKPTALAATIPTIGIAATTAVATTTHTTRAPKALTWLGVVSYSLYLWHVPALALGLPTILGVALALAAACASYYLVEQRFRSRGAEEPRRIHLVGDVAASGRHHTIQLHQRNQISVRPPSRVRVITNHKR